MPSKTITLDSTLRRSGILAAGIITLLFAFVVIRWTLGNAASTRADNSEIARITTQLAPDDPQTHYSVAVLLEKEFDIASVEAAVKEYEAAAALSPNNYLYWLSLGTARERAGDRDGAEVALRRAKELAPHYARVHWALGNALVRQGKLDEGFIEIRQAVAADPALARQSVSLAMQLFGGDIGLVRQRIGDSPSLAAALPAALAESKRFDEAYEEFQRLPSGERKQAIEQSAEQLQQLFLVAKKFRYAVRFVSGPGNFVEGNVSNGGFEDPIKAQNANVFDWQIGSGQQPQIAPTSGQKHSGDLSLVLIFNSTESRDFRTISQTVAVEPGAEYELEAFVRSDLKSKVGFTWEVTNAVNNTLIGATDAAFQASDWKRMTVRFSVPPDTDGIVIRLGRVNCEGPVCQVSGNLWFDDIGLKRTGQ